MCLLSMQPRAPCLRSFPSLLTSTRWLSEVEQSPGRQGRYNALSSGYLASAKGYHGPSSGLKELVLRCVSCKHSRKSVGLSTVSIFVPASLRCTSILPKSFTLHDSLPSLLLRLITNLPPGLHSFSFLGYFSLPVATESARWCCWG